MYGKETLILPKEEGNRTLISAASTSANANRSRGMSWDKRISFPSFLHGGNSNSNSHSHHYQSSSSSSTSNHHDHHHHHHHHDNTTLTSPDGGSSSVSVLLLNNSSSTSTSHPNNNNNNNNNVSAAPGLSGSSSSEQSSRNIKRNLVLTANLRKLKKNRLKWFALYEEEPGDPAHLEYHDDDRKWRAGFPPKRRIVLNQCLNICRKQDSRDSKNKKVIALYTLEDCVGLLFEQEEELRIWLDLLLSHQQGRNSNGKIPKPNYEYMWQVKVRNFTPESKNSQFSMSGVQRLCVTSDDVKFFPVGCQEPIVFPVDCIRNCGTVNRHFRLETGRSSVSGPGLLVIECEDKEIANNINVRVLSSMRASESDQLQQQQQERQHGSSSSNSSRSTPHYNPHLVGSSSTTSGSSSLMSRPRSESWSNLEKPSGPCSAPNPSLKFMKDSSKSIPSSANIMRHRTTSEGGHFDPLKHRRPLISSSPNSPGSFLCSSESAGSSNSIEDGGCSYSSSSLHHHHPSEGLNQHNSSSSGFSSLAPDTSSHVTGEPTIYEESSGESAQEVSSAASLSISTRKSIDTTNKSSVNGIDDDAYTLMVAAAPSEDYMDMSIVSPRPQPPLPPTTLSSSRSISSSAFNRRISLDDTTTTTTSPSHLSSYPHVDDDGDEVDASPVDSSSTPAVERCQHPHQQHGEDDDDEDVDAGVGVDIHSIPLSEDYSSSYVTMSPVSLDIDKLKSIEEEETCFLPPPQSTTCSRHKAHRNIAHRNSYCSSSTTEDPVPRWSPGLLGESCSSSLPLDPDFLSQLDPDSNYVPLDFGVIDRHHPAELLCGRRRISPASSCSIISMPSSVEMMHQPDKVISQIIRDDEDEEFLAHTNQQQFPQGAGHTHRQPSRAYSIGSRPEKTHVPPSLPPLPGKARSSSNASTSALLLPSSSSSTRFIDIPCSNKSSSSSSLLNNTGNNTGNWLKQQSPGSSTGHSPSSSIMSWIRQRTGSVPSRPPFFERRRHRTQSEGEKDDV